MSINDELIQDSHTRSSGTARFSITGESLTRIARDLMLSEEPKKAIRLLVASLVGGGPGEVEHIAKHVLDGAKKLDGDSSAGIDVVDDSDATEYMAQVRYIFAGRIRVKGRWWRPRAKVTDVGQDDARYAHKMTGCACPSTLAEGGRAILDWSRARVEFYAGSKERVFDAGADFIIFEPASEPPHWWDEKNKTPKDALVDFLAAGRRIEEDGWSHRFHVPESRNTPDKTPAAPDTEELVARAEKRRREDREEELRHVAYAAKIENIRRRVIEQAGTDTFQLKLDSGKILTVPRAPFVNWALRRTSLKHLTPPWVPVAESGMKMCGDDPFHTDWTIGAGLTPESAYVTSISEAAYHEAFNLQRRLGQFRCTVLVDAGPVEAEAGDGIVVLPNLDPAHLPKVLGARGIITEAGGRLAHLAQIAMERGVTIMLCEGAVAKFPDGSRVVMTPETGNIVISCRRL